MEGNIFHCNKKCESLEEIIRNSNLCDLLETLPANVVTEKKNVDINTYIFTPPTTHIKKAVHKGVVKKVQTVANLRKAFDLKHTDEVMQTLNKIESLLVQNILKPNDKCLDIESVINDDTPLSRNAWKAICKLGLHGHNYYAQYLLVDGKKVQLPGSCGFSDKVVKYDSSIPRASPPQSNSPSKLTQSTPDINKTSVGGVPYNVRKRRIINDVNLELKPGPLSKKIKINKTDRNNFGGLELVRIPSVGLEVFPSVGVKLDPSVCFLLNNIRNSDGQMDGKWANFATSVLEDPLGKRATDCTSHTFLVPYENNQCRILAQKDLEFMNNTIFPYASDSPIDISNLDCDLPNIDSFPITDDVDACVKDIMANMVTSIAVSEIQDRIGSYDSDYNPSENTKSSKEFKTTASKLQRKTNIELKRLDVTVIDVNENVDSAEDCQMECCKLGCVCQSLTTSYLLNNHCGLPDCMFKCSCNFEKFFNCRSEDADPEISKSAVANLQHHMHKYLAKEEQKFRRTVILSKDQTIVMGACQRGSRLPKKYQDFVFEDVEKPAKPKQSPIDKNVQVVLKKIPSNLKLETWCLIHQLYRCFCKGLFTDGIKYPLNILLSSTNIDNICVSKDNLENKQIESKNSADKKSNILNSAKKVKEIPTDICGIDDKPPDTEQAEKCLSHNNCSRTTFHQKLISRSRKKKHKYTDRNMRILRKESCNPQLKSRLLELIESDKQQFEKNVCKEFDKEIDKKLPTPDKTDKDKFIRINDLIPKSETIEKRLFGQIYFRNPIDSKKLVPTSTNNPIQSEKLLKSDSSKTAPNVNSENSQQSILNSRILHVKKLWKLEEDSMKNRKLLRVVCNDLTNESLSELVIGKMLMFKWEQFIDFFSKSALFIWITLSKPYSILVNNHGKIFSKQKCHPIIYGENVDDTLLHHFPPVLRKIVLLEEQESTFIILEGKMCAWEIIGLINKAPTSDSSAVSNKANAGDSKGNISHYIMPQIRSVHGNVKSINDIKTSLLTQIMKPNDTNEFETVERGPNFTISYKNISQKVKSLEKPERENGREDIENKPRIHNLDCISYNDMAKQDKSDIIAKENFTTKITSSDQQTEQDTTLDNSKEDPIEYNSSVDNLSDHESKNNISGDNNQLGNFQETSKCNNISVAIAENDKQDVDNNQSTPNVTTNLQESLDTSSEMIGVKESNLDNESNRKEKSIVSIAVSKDPIETPSEESNDTITKENKDQTSAEPNDPSSFSEGQTSTESKDHSDLPEKKGDHLIGSESLVGENELNTMEQPLQQNTKDTLTNKSPIRSQSIVKKIIKRKQTNIQRDNNSVNQTDVDHSPNKTARLDSVPSIVSTQATSQAESVNNNNSQRLNNQKYRWLVIKVFNDFTELVVPQKEFKTSYHIVRHLISLSQNSNKISKDTVSDKESDIPEFGIYVIPENGFKEVFIGPCPVDEQIGLRVYRKKDYVGDNTCASWTMPVKSADFIVRDQRKNPNSVFFIGNTKDHYKLPPNFSFNLVASNVITKVPDATRQKNHSADNNSQSDDEDVIFVPDRQTVIEISDSEEE